MDLLDCPASTGKTLNHRADSAIAHDFRDRDEDIVIAAYGKSGTSWMQQIVAQLLFGGELIDLPAVSPWLDLRLPPQAGKPAALAVQTHRRFIKTHLPAHVLPYSQRTRYVYLAHDGRDAVGGGRAEPDASVREHVLARLERDDHPLRPFWGHVRGWWDIRHRPNLLLVHHADLQADPAGEIRRVAAFLGIAIDPTQWPRIVEHCRFADIAANGAGVMPLAAAFLRDGAPFCIRKGPHGRWRDMLSAEDIRRYEEAARAQLGEDCADWLAHGRRAGI